MLRSLYLEGRACVLTALVSFGCGAPDEKDGAYPINPSFDDWCERNLCDWTTTQGRVEQVSTWHANDLGVSLIETPTEISQLLGKTVDDGGCLLFDTIADIAPEADVSIVLDFNNDGIEDVEQRFSSVRWKSVSFPVRTPVAYQSLRVSVIKRGEGRAVLALLRVVAQSNCTSAPLPLKGGSKCSQDAVCESRRCQEGRCTSLTPGASSE